MAFASWIPFASGRAAARALPAVPAARPYVITVLCPESVQERVEQLVRLTLDDAGLPPAEIATHSAAHHANAGMDARMLRVLVSCPVERRGILVRLVQEIGLIPPVRSVRWETVPSCLPPLSPAAATDRPASRQRTRHGPRP